MTDDIKDLTALVLTVAPPEPLTTPAHLGRATHALLLRLIADSDPALADEMHNSSGPRPFTCSTVVGGKRQDRTSRLYHPDVLAWFRLTGLTTAVSAHLQQLAADPPDTVELDGRVFHVKQATLDTNDHPWAGQSSYQALATPYLLAQTRPRYQVGLHFASPTAFRSNSIQQPVPMPQWVFGSLLRRWNHFSSIQLAAEVLRFAEECVALSKYRLQTRAIPMKRKVVQIGCVGRARYHLLNRDKFWASMINLLAAYSFYSGVGYQTTVGMGQTQPLSASGSVPG